MADTFLSGFSGLAAGFVHLQWSNLVMIIIGVLLLYLGIKKDFEPLLLVPIGFGCIIVNIPLSDLMETNGFLRIIYDAGIIIELFPLLIFVGIGAMTDFRPVLENPYTFLLGAAGISAFPMSARVVQREGQKYNIPLNACHGRKRRWTGRLYHGSSSYALCIKGYGHHLMLDSKGF